MPAFGSRSKAMPLCAWRSARAASKSFILSTVPSVDDYMDCRVFVRLKRVRRGDTVDVIVTPAPSSGKTQIPGLMRMLLYPVPASCGYGTSAERMLFSSRGELLPVQQFQQSTSFSIFSRTHPTYRHVSHFRKRLTKPKTSRPYPPAEPSRALTSKSSRCGYYLRVLAPPLKAHLPPYGMIASWQESPWFHSVLLLLPYRSRRLGLRRDPEAIWLHSDNR